LTTVTVLGPRRNPDKKQPFVFLGEAGAVTNLAIGCQATRFGDILAGLRTGSRQTIKGLHHNAYRCRDSEETRDRVRWPAFMPTKIQLRFQVEGVVQSGLGSFFAAI
jgi:hypothetical protein